MPKYYCTKHFLQNGRDTILIKFKRDYFGAWKSNPLKPISTQPLDVGHLIWSNILKIPSLFGKMHLLNFHRMTFDKRSIQENVFMSKKYRITITLW